MKSPGVVRRRLWQLRRPAASNSNSTAFCLLHLASLDLIFFVVTDAASGGGSAAAAAAAAAAAGVGMKSFHGEMNILCCMALDLRSSS